MTDVYVAALLDVTVAVGEELSARLEAIADRVAALTTETRRTAEALAVA